MLTYVSEIFNTNIPHITSSTSSVFQITVCETAFYWLLREALSNRKKAQCRFIINVIVALSPCSG